MKTFFYILLLLVSAKFTNAQGTIAGSVKDGSGKPLHDVFIGDPQRANAVFSDSLGNFSITTQAGSKLLFEADGFKDTTISAGQISAGLQ
jgi:hypothetical protein